MQQLAEELLGMVSGTTAQLTVPMAGHTKHHPDYGQREDGSKNCAYWMTVDDDFRPRTYELTCAEMNTAMTTAAADFDSRHSRLK